MRETNIKLLLIRHGETEWNLQRRIQGGGSDPELSSSGRAQAKALAKHLKNFEIEAIYSSPLKRAMYTGKAIAYYHNLKVHSERDLREVDVGEMEGTSLDSLYKDFSSYLIESSDHTGTLKIAGGESLTDLRERVWTVVQRIKEQHTRTVIITSHYFVTISIICMALQLPIEGIRRFRVQPASISELDFSDSRILLTSVNDTCHLQTGA